MKNIALQRQSNIANMTNTNKRKKRTLGDRFKAKREKRRLEKLNGTAASNGDSGSDVNNNNDNDINKNNNNNNNGTVSNKEKNNKQTNGKKDAANARSTTKSASKVSNNNNKISAKNDLNSNVIKQVTKTINKKHDMKKQKKQKTKSPADLEDQHFQKLVDKYKVQLFGEQKNSKSKNDDSGDKQENKKRWFQ